MTTDHQAGDSPDSPAGTANAVGTERLLTFSDGVFAIAITLLVLSVQVPHVSQGLATALWHQWPAYLSFVMSFIIIGIIWAQHHQMFRHIERVDHAFLLVNVVFLMWVASLPFPTALLADYLRHASEERTAMAIYAGTFVVGSLLFNLLWRYATWGERLTGDALDRDAIRRVNQSYNPGVFLYLADFALAFVSVWASLALFLAIAAFYGLTPLFRWDVGRFDGVARRSPRDARVRSGDQRGGEEDDREVEEQIQAREGD